MKEMIIIIGLLFKIISNLAAPELFPSLISLEKSTYPTFNLFLFRHFDHPQSLTMRASPVTQFPNSSSRIIPGHEMAL